MEIKVEELGEAIRHLDGGCPVRICEMLNALPITVSNQVADWINKECPILGYDTLVYDDLDGWVTFDMTVIKTMIDKE